MSNDERFFFVNVDMAYTINLNIDYVQFFLVMSSVVNGGNLTQYLNAKSPPSSEMLFEIMGSLVIGLAVLHTACIRYHDIHPGKRERDSEEGARRKIERDTAASIIQIF